MPSICEALNVLELGAGSIAASMTGMVLADAGARVIKVEPPDGDRLRTENPSGFLVWNRGKESQVADLRTAAGQQQLFDLAANADVVIEGFTPGITYGWGIDVQSLHAANPKLVHCAITGFGPTGPYSHLKSYDSIVAAKLGLWARGDFGHREGPMLMPVPWASFGAAMQAVAGIMGALLVRERTGAGQSVNATLAAGLDPTDYMSTTIVQLAAKRGAAEGGGANPTANRYGVLVATRDGRLIQTSTMLPHQGRSLCEVAGITHMLDEPRFSRLPMFDNADDAQAWEDLLLEAFLREDLSHWLPKLEANADIAFEVARTSEEGMAHPQIVHNGDVIAIDDPRAGPVRQVGPLGHFSQTPMAPRRSAPLLGENTGIFVASEAPTGGGAPPAHPYAGITIIEFGYFYAMPYGTAMAAALGARVIKIEDGNGDPHRTSFGPEVGSNKTMAAKESISLDLKTPEGQKIAHALVEQADVFVTGFRAGIAEKLGLGYDDLKHINPRLLYIHAAGYGSDGPYAHRALYAQAAQTVAGSFGRQVGYWSDPARVAGWSVMELQALVFPRLHQVIDGDSNAALGLLGAMALGIYHQQRTGEGQRLNTSMIAGNCWAYADDFCTYADKPPTPLCDDDYYGTCALDRLYAAADDSWLCLAVRTQAEFETLVRSLGRPELASNDSFSDAHARKTHDNDLISVLGDIFATKPALEWEAVLSAVDIGAAAVTMEGQAVFTSFDEGLRESGLTTTFAHPLYGDMVRTAPPVTFSDTTGRVAPPCLRGQHNRTLLTELGYGQEEIAGLETRGIVIPASTNN